MTDVPAQATTVVRSRGGSSSRVADRLPTGAPSRSRAEHWRWSLVAGVLFGLFTLHVLVDHHNDSHAPAVITSAAEHSPAAQADGPEQPHQHLLDDCILFLVAVSSVLAIGFTATGRNAPRTTVPSSPTGGFSFTAAGIRLPQFLLSVQRT